MCLDYCCKLDHNRRQRSKCRQVEYDPTFQGPLKNRSCTDVICLFLFIVFIACWIGVGLFVFTNGNKDILLLPVDSNNSRCGYDPHVAEKKKLFFFDITKCLSPAVPFTGCPTNQICVEECPKDTFLWNKNSELNYMKLKCVQGIQPKNNEEGDDFVNKGLCARYHLKSNDLLNRCIPDVTDDFSQITNQIKDLTKDNVETSVKNIELLQNMEQVGHDIIKDIVESWREILGGIGIAIVACLIYMLMLRWIAGPVVWISIVATIAGLAACVYFTVTYYIYYKDHPKEEANANTIFQQYVRKKGFWLTLLIISSVALLIDVLMVIFLRKRIFIAIAIIGEASKAVSSTLMSFVFPIFPWIFQMAIIAFTLVVALYITTISSPQYEVKNFDKSNCNGDYEDGDSCDMNSFKKVRINNCKATCEFVGMGLSSLRTPLHVFNGFAFFWSIFFISAFGQMVQAGIFATWYWTRDKSDVPFWSVTKSVARTLRYHIGTLAFGSLILAICRMIRVALEYIDHKLKKYDNPFTKAILCCMKCFFWCLERFLKFLNKNAYIMCAIHGKNFCTSAKDAFSLIIRNILRFHVLDKVTDFVLFMSKLIITAGVAAIVWSFVTYVSERQLKYILVPVIFVAIVTYLVTSFFFNVYSMAVDTLFLCFLEDNERNDGSAHRPYYMSKNLRAILGKKNKTS
ncbi:PREDICTED: CTL-like protein 2 isoform X2 [Nicrophorus vespilloides]|uniref:Choline transporter-like protein n=1 Tax=Nicrophorus vespilloides TaxID=110193 RepID=A0ABM1MRU9_NICVS|nr:PREDICTED: CTL-like protein 2 isoform X2 [Nicrophorus vespilloides]